VSLAGDGRLGAVGHHVGERLVGGHLPLDRDRAGAHATVEVERFGGEPGPQHHAVRARLAGGDAEAERVGRQQAAPGRARQAGNGDRATRGETGDDEQASVELGHAAS
jgi:hypothetical protein